jgi:uroporphyrinogen decarboxylase
MSGISLLDMQAWLAELCRAPRRALPIMTYPGLALTQQTITDVISNGANQARCIAALAEKYPSAAAVTIMDLSVEAEAFGCPIRYSDEDVPTVTSRLVSDMESVMALKVPAVGAGRTGVYLEAARLATEQINDRPVFGGHIGPLSLAARLFDMNDLMMALALEPELAHCLMEKCTLFLIEYAKAFKATGAHGIVMAEPAAGLLSAAHCAEFSSAYVRRIVEAVQDDNFIVVLHNCGKTVKLVPSMLSTGARAFHFGNAVDMAEIMPQIPADRVAMGNLDPSSVFRYGTAEEMREKGLALLDKLEAYPNYVLSSGCDVPPGSPLANVEAFYAVLAEWNARQTCKA